VQDAFKVIERAHCGEGSEREWIARGKIGVGEWLIYGHSGSEKRKT
jgi:hypothetical protein